jgi:hypothetical protein
MADIMAERGPDGSFPLKLPLRMCRPRAAWRLEAAQEF